MPIILAIESSCDDTGAAVWQDGYILSNVVADQDMHRRLGGVVPEVASRAHQEFIMPVVESALAEAGIALTDISAIAFTRGPGLLGSLLVGVTFAKSLALALNVPMIEVNHLEAHTLAHLANGAPANFPYLCLLVSGGHTQIVQVLQPLDMKMLGTTIDDAAGEAFDKIGKMLGLEYPAGPLLDKLAQQGEPRFRFAEAQVPHLDFSFSGLKTSVLYFLKDQVAQNPDFINQNLNDLCASVQQTIVKTLLNKLKKAIQLTGIREITVAGGVAANRGLRAGLQALSAQEGLTLRLPEIQFCTDNAGMIALAASYKYQAGLFVDHTVAPVARWATGTK